MEIIKRYWWVALVLGLLAVIGWLFPSYKKEVRTNETKTIRIAQLEKEVETWKNKKVTKITYYPEGGKKSETHIDVDEGSSSRENTNTVENTVTKEKVVIIEKRGQFVVGTGIDSGGYPSILLQSTLLGPLGLAGTASFQTIPVGLHSGAVYVTFAF